MTEQTLRDLLAERSRRCGHPGPVVATLGLRDVTGGLDGAGHREATVHISPQAVLIGPWGGSSEGAACGHCLAIRWQRLRTKPWRDALETGSHMRAAGTWPALTDHVIDTVWQVYRAAFHHARAEP